jgi:hypothetical protein
MTKSKVFWGSPFLNHLVGHDRNQDHEGYRSFAHPPAPNSPITPPFRSPLVLFKVAQYGSVLIWVLVLIFVFGVLHGIKASRLNI